MVEPMELELDSKLVNTEYYNKRSKARLEIPKKTVTLKRAIVREKAFNPARDYLNNDKKSLRLLDDLSFVVPLECNTTEECKVAKKKLLISNKSGIGDVQ